jgi:hypothetical protein
MNEIKQQQQYYNMVNTSKMGDLDINLITLYARTPALFDKRNPFYKDKQYSERAWNDISMKLGYKGNASNHELFIRCFLLMQNFISCSRNSQRSYATIKKSL